MAGWRLKHALLYGIIAASIPLGAALASGGGGGMGGGGGPMMPSQSAQQYDPAQEYRNGMTAYQAGKFKDAARSFDHVTQAAPGEANGWRMLGLARSGADDGKGAAKAFERALKIDPKAVDTRRDYALALTQLKMADKAQRRAGRAEEPRRGVRRHLPRRRRPEGGDRGGRGGAEAG